MNEQSSTQVPQSNQPQTPPIPETRVGSTINDVVNILTGLTGMAYMSLCWSSEDGKFFMNNQGSWVEYSQFRPLKLTPEMFEKFKVFVTEVPGAKLYYIDPSNVRSTYTKLLS